MTKDGQRIVLMINAGLAIDLPHIEETGAAGIGLFRTELQFMVASTFPRTQEQLALYRAVLDAAGKKPVTFRTLDIGGDKVLPYMRNVEEENPALGWRAIRLGLDRPGLLRSQLRALLRASGGRELRLMFPMIAMVEEFDKAKALVELELTHLRRHGHPLPERVEIGTMLEVPSLLFQLDELLERVDFLSVGSNDLMQFLYAADRGNVRVSRALRSPVGAGAARAQGHRRPRQEARQAGGAVRRARLAADRRAGAGDPRLPRAVAVALGGRPGQGAADGARRAQGRAGDPAAPGAAGRQRVDPPQAGKLRGGGGAAALIALPQQKLDALLARHALVESELATNLTPDAYVKLSREFAELGPVIAAIKAYRAVAGEIADLQALIDDPATDGEMRKLAEAEKPALAGAQGDARAQDRLALIPKDAMDEHNAILEIRAGTGGDEAALFAGDLFRMYERYAAKMGWKTEILSMSEGSKGGFKEIVAEMRGRGVFAKLKFESGVHRVQRVPDTEASGRIHTSAATVAVLPEVEDVDVDIDEKDLKIDTMRASGAGGQHVNKTEFGDPHHAICRAASWSTCRRSARSTRTAPRP